jgi:hypothetical protein
MFGSQNTQPYQPPRPLGQDYRRSSSNEMSKALPLIYGRQRVGCEFISDVFDVMTQAVSSGGKDSRTEGYNYYASFLVAVCHGPVLALHDLYLNGDPVFTNATQTLPIVITEAYNAVTQQNVATVQTANPHGLTTGQTVVLYNCVQDYFNGEFQITVVSATQFQYIIPGAEIDGATAQAVAGTSIYYYVQLDPIYANGGDSTEFTIPDFGTATIYWGTQTQQPDAYTATVSGIQHPPYKGICYIVFRQLYLGFNQTNVQNVEVVVERTPTFPGQSVPGNSNLNGDCNPAVIAADLMLSPVYGLGADSVLDFNAASFDAACNQFYSENVGFSPNLNRPNDTLSSLNEILSMVDAAVTLDGNGLLALAMQRQSTISNVVVGDANCVELASFTPEDWSSVINQTYLNFLDRDSGWQPDYVSWQDGAGIYAKERAEPQALDKEFITDRALATKLCATAGQLSALPKQDGKLTLAFCINLFTTLAPGVAFTYTSALRPALNGVYRVTSRSVQDPAKPVFEIEVSIDRSYLYVQASTASGIGSAISQPGGGSGNTSPPVPDLQPIPAPSPSAIVELPFALCPNGLPAIGALVARSTQSDSFATVYLGRNYVFNGTPPASFFQFAAITGFALNGTLSADFPASTPFVSIANPLPAEAGNVGQPDSDFPVAAGLQIQLTGVDLILPGVCDFDALANSVLLFVDDEIMSIAEATLTGVGAYSLTVIRGRFGTPIDDHGNGDSVWIIPLANLQPLQHPHFLAGNDAQFKLTIGQQDVSDVTAFDVTFVGNRWPGTKDASGTWTADSTNITADQD